jgi:hypothetical protein
MKVSQAMVDAARRGEFNHYQRGRMLNARFIPTPDAVIRAMLEAALASLPDEPQPPPGGRGTRIAVARKPRRQ